MTRHVTLLTDFGTVDGYAAAMKGVVASRCPGALVSDVSHDLSQGDVRGAMWALRRYWRLYPEGSVHVIVVDPGVGTERRALAVEADGRYVVAPDNGVISFVWSFAADRRAVEIREVEPAVPGGSTTFHGRDVFAPAAAHLLAGGALVGLGPPVEDPLLLGVPEPARTAEGARGEVVHVDRFGNLVTNLPGEWARDRSRVKVAGRALALSASYGHAERGEVLAVVNSDDLVEVAVRDGSAASLLQVGLGAPVRLEP